MDRRASEPNYSRRHCLEGAQQLPWGVSGDLSRRLQSRDKQVKSVFSYSRPHLQGPLAMNSHQMPFVPKKRCQARPPALQGKSHQFLIKFPQEAVSTGGRKAGNSRTDVHTPTGHVFSTPKEQGVGATLLGEARLAGAAPYLWAASVTAAGATYQTNGRAASASPWGTPAGSHKRFL